MHGFERNGDLDGAEKFETWLVDPEDEEGRLSS
jgi:hypothetical protein